MDLYAKTLPDHLDWTRPCGGNQQEEEMESCVEIAPIPGVQDAYVLRDSKNPTAGTLRFTGAELRAAGISTI